MIWKVKRLCIKWQYSDAEPFETMKLKQLLADLTEVVLLGGAHTTDVQKIIPVFS